MTVPAHDRAAVRPAFIDDPQLAAITVVTSNELDFLGGSHRPYDLMPVIFRH